jgi:3-oxoacyl-[acyl-carrier protein] reductase
MKTVLITGASRGIGKAIALKFATEGYNTIITCSKSIQDLLAVESIIKKMGVKCLPIIADISKPYEVNHMFEEAFLIFPSIDILINNAGINLYKLITETTNTEWAHLINTNLNSVFYTSRAILPQMIKKHTGSIVNISSIWGTYGASMEVAYSTSKAGVNGFTKALAREVGPSGIRVNAVACGAIGTSMNQRFSSEELEAFTDQIALCRLGTSEEVADMVYHIATQAAYLNGEIIHYDGGY